MIHRTTTLTFTGVLIEDLLNSVNTPLTFGIFDR